MRPRIDAVLFDLDGTLVATMQLWDRCWADYAARHGHIWTDTDRRGTHGRGDWADHLALVCGNMPVGQVIEDCTDLMIAQIRAGRTALSPGVDALLVTAANTVTTGLVSASARRFVQATVAHFDLHRYFRVVVAREDQVATKPHPARYLHAAHLLGVHPHHCVAVEDSVAGIRSAHAAGMQVPAIPSWAPGPRPPELDLVSYHAEDPVQADRRLRAALSASITEPVHVNR